MKVFQGEFLLSPEEVTLEKKNHLIKTYRHAGYEMRSIYHGSQFLQEAYVCENSQQVIICFEFRRQLFMPMMRWIESQRQQGFKGRILLSMSAETFDYGVIPKFLACGGSFVIDQGKWVADPLWLIADKHDTSVTTWLYNQEHKKELEVFNDEALEYLYNELLNKKKLPLDTLNYIYKGLNVQKKKELMTLLKQKIRVMGNSLVRKPSIEGLKEGIITVWDNPEFCCELGMSITKLTNKKVLIVDLDRLNPTFDMYCPPSRGQKKAGTLGDIQRLHNANKLSNERLMSLCGKVKNAGGLNVLYGCSELKKFEYFTNDALIEALAQFKKSYDVVLLNVNHFIYDAYTCLALIKSNYVLIPVDGKITSIRNYQRSMELLCEKQQVEQEKFHYVFFECEEMFSGEMQLLAELLQGPILGWISPCKRRRYFRNLKRTYAQGMSKQVMKEYEGLVQVLIN
jgi:cellulose biosynthesis protein BcsQ